MKKNFFKSLYIAVVASFATATICVFSVSLINTSHAKPSTDSSVIDIHVRATTDADGVISFISTDEGLWSFDNGKNMGTQDLSGYSPVQVNNYISDRLTASELTNVFISHIMKSQIQNEIDFHIEYCIVKNKTFSCRFSVTDSDGAYTIQTTADEFFPIISVDATGLCIDNQNGNAWTNSEEGSLPNYKLDFSLDPNWKGLTF